MKFALKTATIAASLLFISCADSNFSSSADGGNSKKSDNNSNLNQSGEPSTGKTDDATNPYANGDVNVKDGTYSIAFADPSKAIMFRGTRGLNLPAMTVGVLLNESDRAILQKSQGAYVASGLRTGSKHNDWGVFVKSVKPIVTAPGFTERRGSCAADEIVIGLPDRGIDDDTTHPEVTDSWKNKLLCAKVAAPYRVKEIKSLNYTHKYDFSVDCPDTSLLNGYECGNCYVPSPAVLKCVVVEPKS